MNNKFEASTPAVQNEHYEAPSAEVIEMQIEGVLLHSTIDFGDGGSDEF